VKGISPIPCLETNIYAVPTEKASGLNEADKDDSIFLYLLETIRPKIVFVHSDEPIRFFEQHTGCTNFCDGQPRGVMMNGIRFVILGLPGPLYVKSYKSVLAWGHLLRGFANSATGCI